MAKKKIEDIRPDFKVAIINYNKKFPEAGFTQADIAPEVTQAHVNNVAAGRSINHGVRDKIEKFIEDWG